MDEHQHVNQLGSQAIQLASPPADFMKHKNVSASASFTDTELQMGGVVVGVHEHYTMRKRFAKIFDDNCWD